MICGQRLATGSACTNAPWRGKPRGRLLAILIAAAGICHAHTVRIVTEDLSSENPLDGIRVDVKGKSPGTADTSGVSDSAGSVRFELDGGVYEVFFTNIRCEPDSIDLVVDRDIDTTVYLKATGIIHSDTLLLDTLYRTESPYYFRGPLYIPSLYIESGVHIIVLDTGGDPQKAVIRVDKMYALGEPGDSVVWSSENEHHYVMHPARTSSKAVFRCCVLNNVVLYIEMATDDSAFVFQRSRFTGAVISSMSKATLVDNIVDAQIADDWFGTGMVLVNNRFMTDVTFLNITSTTRIRNNNFYGRVYIQGPLPNGVEICDNLFRLVEFSDNDFSDASVSHNLYSEYIGNPMPGFGTLATTNVNGDSCDFYYNLFGDPLIEDSLSGRLADLSPARGAASDGGSIGAWQEPGTGLLTGNAKTPKHHIPLVRATMTGNRVEVVVGLASPATGAVTIYDARGRRVASEHPLMLIEGENAVELPVGGVAAGVYSYRMCIGARRYGGRVLAVR